MEQTEKSALLAKQTLTVISTHAVIYLLYHYAHGKTDIMYAMTESMPLLLILCCAPLAAVALLSTRMARQGIVLLLGILPAELVYNIYTRFTPTELMNPEQPVLIWKILFEGSFGIVLVLEVVAFWMSVNVWREFQKQMDSSSEH
jgi:hypothetical protein